MKVWRIVYKSDTDLPISLQRKNYLPKAVKVFTMKLQIVLFVLVGMALTISAERSKGRRSNIRLDQLMRNQKDAPSSRMWKNKQQSTPAQIIVVEAPAAPPPQNTYYYTPDVQTYYYYNTGYETLSPATSNRSLSSDELLDDDEDEDKVLLENEDDDDEANDDHTSARYKKQKNNYLKLKKTNKKDQEYRVIVPAKYMRQLKQNAHASKSKSFNNGVNKLRMLRLNSNDNANTNLKRKSLRRLARLD